MKKIYKKASPYSDTKMRHNLTFFSSKYLNYPFNSKNDSQSKNFTLKLKRQLILFKISQDLRFANHEGGLKKNLTRKQFFIIKFWKTKE